MPDAELIMADVFGVQISCKPGPASSSMHHNYDQIVPMDAFSHSTTNHYLTCILRAIVQVSVVISRFTETKALSGGGSRHDVGGPARQCSVQ